MKTNSPAGMLLIQEEGRHRRSSVPVNLSSPLACSKAKSLTSQVPLCSFVRDNEALLQPPWGLSKGMESWIASGLCDVVESFHFSLPHYSSLVNGYKKQQQAQRVKMSTKNLRMDLIQSLHRVSLQSWHH